MSALKKLDILLEVFQRNTIRKISGPISDTEEQQQIVARIWGEDKKDGWNKEDVDVEQKIEDD